MKPEPLKDKLGHWAFQAWAGMPVSTWEYDKKGMAVSYHPDDILSAVEWLKIKHKNKLHELWTRKPCLLSTAYEEMLELTDKAFQDVLRNDDISSTRKVIKK